MDDVRELIERLERASGPDRELDGEIACAIFKTIGTDDDLIYRSPIRRYDQCAPGTYWLVSRSGRSLQTAPHYTGSIDAAMRLVPKDHDVSITQASGPGRTDWSATCVERKEYGNPIRPHGEGATAASAISIAALRARALIAQPKEPAHE